MAQSEVVIRSMADFGPALRQLRKARNLSQKELARILDVDQQEISRWEVRPSVVSQANFLKVLWALNAELVLRF